MIEEKADIFYIAPQICGALSSTHIKLRQNIEECVFNNILLF
jgi:hypothetical protein